MDEKKNSTTGMKTRSYLLTKSDKGIHFTEEREHASRAEARRYANAEQRPVALYDAMSGALLSVKEGRAETR